MPCGGGDTSSCRKVTASECRVEVMTPQVVTRRPPQIAVDVVTPQVALRCPSMLQTVVVKEALLVVVKEIRRQRT